MLSYLMKFFQYFYKLMLWLLMTALAYWTSSYAFELNSGNVAWLCSDPYGFGQANYCGLQWLWITSIASGTFAQLSHLETIDLWYLYDTSDWTILWYNGITSIESGDFAGLSNLTFLHLWNNQITSIESGDFAGLSNLTFLYLGGSQITSIENWDFSGLSNLTILDLGGNQITSIENWDFSGLSSLMSFSLQSNQITSIESGDLNGLSALMSLYLGGNQITSIENWDFDGLSALTTLSLQSNQITSIESGDLNGLSALTTLDVQNNCLNIEDTLVTNYLNTLPGIQSYQTQFVCLQVEYSTKTTTNWPVTGSLKFVWPTSKVVLISGDNPNLASYDHVFTENGSHLYNYSSLIDNGQSMGWIDHLWTRYNTSYRWVYIPDTVLWSVTWIDTTPPIGTLSYSTTGITNQSVTAILTLNESWSVLNNTGSFTYTFTGNGSFTFEYQDIAGNTGSVTASVTWIDKVSPIITLIWSGTVTITNGNTYTDLGASWTDDRDGTGFILSPTSGSVNTGLSGTYLLEYTHTDLAGNTGASVTRTVIVLPPVVIIPPVVTPPRASSWWGWGGSSLSLDSCPGGDYSSSYYDRSCGTKPITTDTTIQTTTGIVTIPTTDTTSRPFRPIPSILTNNDGNNNDDETDNDDENIITDIITQTTNTVNTAIKAYERSSSIGITNADTVQEARLDTTITRAELAKMISIYATDVLGQIPSDTACEFEDADKANKWLLPYITQVCQLNIMGLESDGKTPLTQFRPNAFVTRAEFGTALSRVLYGTTYNNDSTNTEWREEHLDNLYKNNIISLTDPTLQEQRGWVMTMLYRTIQE